MIRKGPAGRSACWWKRFLPNFPLLNPNDHVFLRGEKAIPVFITGEETLGHSESRQIRAILCGKKKFMGDKYEF
jgi:hypothetical protein